MGTGAVVMPAESLAPMQGPGKGQGCPLGSREEGSHEWS